jgi:hypothetical protein
MVYMSFFKLENSCTCEWNLKICLLILLANVLPFAFNFAFYLKSSSSEDETAVYDDIEVPCVQ